MERKVVKNTNNKRQNSTGALKLVIEPIFEADFQDGSYGFDQKEVHMMQYIE